MLNIDVAMRTDRGVVRQSNQDAVGGDPSVGLVLLADGMGGANAGEVASGLAIDLLIKKLVIERNDTDRPLEVHDLREALLGVNHAILDLAQQVPEYHGMGTTVVLGLFQQSRFTYAHVGDSRVYRLRDGQIRLMTRDHTLLQELLGMGEFASIDDALQAGVPSHVLSRAFGVEAELEVDIAQENCREGDLFLFCSDGLSNMMSDEEMLGILTVLRLT